MIGNLKASNLEVELRTVIPILLTDNYVPTLFEQKGQCYCLANDNVPLLSNRQCKTPCPGDKSQVSKFFFKKTGCLAREKNSHLGT
jgi:hypothetical protein